MVAAWDPAAGTAPGGIGADETALGRALTFGCELAGAAKPAGLALVFQAGSFSVHVTDSAGAARLVLGPYDETDVIAIWRSLASASGLPLLVAGPDGVLQHVQPQLGRLRLGDTTDRARLKVLSGRRPRFLVRRKSGRMPLRPLVYREREIMAGDQV